MVDERYIQGTQSWTVSSELIHGILFRERRKGNFCFINHSFFPPQLTGLFLNSLPPKVMPSKKMPFHLVSRNLRCAFLLKGRIYIQIITSVSTAMQKLLVMILEMPYMSVWMLQILRSMWITADTSKWCIKPNFWKWNWENSNAPRNSLWLFPGRLAL